MSEGDRLSDLPDDLLRRILHILPAKEGASTSALARRWRWIWLSSGAVNLDSRSYDLDHKRGMIIRHARAALAAAHGHGFPVWKFTFRYEEGEDGPLDINNLASYEDDLWHGQGAMARDLHALLYTRLASHVEELRLGLFYDPDNDDHQPVGLYKLYISALSCSQSLRVLHISKCMDWEWDYCKSWRRVYVGVIDVAPHLVALHLDGVEPMLSSPTACSFSLRCPKITNLVLANFYFWSYRRQNTMELDAPLLRRFTFEGPIRPLSLKSPPPDIARIDLRFHVPARIHEDDGT
ncbi:unnamed protein product [Alopecurus aequalis]